MSPQSGPETAAADPAARIAARLDRLPMTGRLWSMVAMISLGGAFEFYDLLFTGYNPPGWFGFDDVSVTQLSTVPLPGAITRG